MDYYRSSKHRHSGVSTCANCRYCISEYKDNKDKDKPRPVSLFYCDLRLGAIRYKDITYCTRHRAFLEGT